MPHPWGGGGGGNEMEKNHQKLKAKNIILPPHFLLILYDLHKIILISFLESISIMEVITWRLIRIHRIHTTKKTINSCQLPNGRMELKSDF